MGIEALDYLADDFDEQAEDKQATRFPALLHLCELADEYI
jgi:hypothetical protein